MSEGGNGKRTGLSSPFDFFFDSLSAKVLPLVRTELTEVLITELRRHFTEELLPDLNKRVAEIVERELLERVHAIVIDRLTAHLDARAGGPLDRALSERLPGIIDQTLAERLPGIIDGALPLKLSQAYLPNNIIGGSFNGEYMAASVPVTSDFLHPDYLEFCRLNQETVAMHRKPWEWAFIYHHLGKGGVLRPGMRGLGFGVGTERLPSVFAHLGAHVTATDAPSGEGWEIIYAGEKEKLFFPDIVNREVFDERVSYELCDMNDISSHLNGYDFCWSACAFEHLGGLKNGLDFVINSVEKTLKVGGIACHTTELNLSSEEHTVGTGDTVLYRKKDLEELCKTLEDRGHWVEPLRIHPGTLPPDYAVDLPPYRSGWHLKLLVGSYVTTSVGIVARRGR